MDCPPCQNHGGMSGKQPKDEGRMKGRQSGGFFVQLPPSRTYMDFHLPTLDPSVNHVDYALVLLIFPSLSLHPLNIRPTPLLKYNYVIKLKVSFIEGNQHSS